MSEAMEGDESHIQGLINLRPYRPWECRRIGNTFMGVTKGWGEAISEFTSWPLWFVNELLLGMVIFFAQVPETISFSLLAKVNPVMGMHGCYIIGLFSTIFGGRPGLICGVTGAVAAMTGNMIVETEGRVELIGPIVIIAGVLLLVFGMAQLGFMVRSISKNVMIGFCNGLAVIIGMSQLHNFNCPQESLYWNESQYCSEPGAYITGEPALHMAVMCLLAMFVFYIWVRVPVAGKYFPAALVALMSSFAYEYGVVQAARGLKTLSVGDIGQLNVSARFPKPFWLWATWTDLHLEDSVVILKNGFMLFTVVVLESLMTVVVVDDCLGTKSERNDTIVAIGMGNIVSGFLGGIGGNTMMGLTGLLIKSGGKGKEAGVICGIAVMMTTFFASGLLNYVPTAGLAGVMFVVVLGTFSLDSLYMVLCTCIPEKLRNRKDRFARKIPKWDAVILVVVSVLVPTAGLSIGIITGVILSLMAFENYVLHEIQVYGHTMTLPLASELPEGATPNWDNIKGNRSPTSMTGDSDTSPTTTIGLTTEAKIYDIVGPFFYSSAEMIQDIFDVNGDPHLVVIRMQHSALLDYTAMEGLSSLITTYRDLGKHVKVVKITDKCETKLAMAKATLDFRRTDFAEMGKLPEFVNFADEMPCLPAPTRRGLRRRVTDFHVDGRRYIIGIEDRAAATSVAMAVAATQRQFGETQASPKDII